MPASPIRFSYEANLANLSVLFFFVRPRTRWIDLSHFHLDAEFAVVVLFIILCVIGLINFVDIPLSFELPTLLIKYYYDKGSDSEILEYEWLESDEKVSNRGD
jgi:hypothetical protein